MSLHPPGGRVTGSALRRVLVSLVLASLLVAGCVSTPAPRPSPEPTLPPDQFGGLPDRPAHVRDRVEAMMAEGDAVVAVSRVVGRVRRIAFHSSTDGGRTWVDGSLTEGAAQASRPDERVYAAAVASDGQGRRWLALGDDDAAFVAWTSADGVRWDRTPTTGLDFAVTSLSTVRAVGGRFVVVGEVNEGETAPGLFTSTDGITWERRPVPGKGSLDDIAGAGQTWVAVGEAASPTVDDTGRLTTPLLHTSLDGGATWSATPVPLPEGDDGFVVSLTSVVAHRDGFSAGGIYWSTDEEYRPFVLDSADGLTWSLATEEGLPAPSRSLTLASVDGSLSAFGTGGDPATLWHAQRSEGGWSANPTPWVPGGASLIDLVTVPSGVLVARTWDGGRDADFVRFPVAEGAPGVTEPAFPAPPMAPSLEPGAIVVRGDEVSVWGRAQGATVEWRRTPEGPWEAPRIIRDDAREGFKEVEVGPRGTVLSLTREGEPVLAASRDGVTWQQTDVGELNEVGEFASAVVRDVEWVGDRWVAVGGRTSNGLVRQSALARWSEDGVTWNPGTHTSVIRRGDGFSETDQATDLDGLEGLGRGMSSVVATPTGVLAFGWELKGSKPQPAVWRSEKGVAWSLSPLPTGGAVEATAQRGVVSGAHVLVVGFQRRESGGWEGTAWLSTDAGQTFESVRVGDLTTAGRVFVWGTDEGFVVVADAEDGRGTTVWSSPDGRAWTAHPVLRDALGAATSVTTVDVAVWRDRLLVLQELRRPDHAVTVLTDVPRPRP